MRTNELGDHKVIISSDVKLRFQSDSKQKEREKENLKP